MNLGYKGPRSQEEDIFQASAFSPSPFSPNYVPQNRVMPIESFVQPSSQEMSTEQKINSPKATVDPELLNDPRYNPDTGLRGTKAFRNNNPGNISGMGGKLLYGASGFARNKHGDVGDRTQLVFQDARSGWRGMHQLMSSKNYNNAPISDAFSKYQSDQNVWDYMKNDMKKYGINPSKSRFNDLSPDQKVWFMNQRARFEGYGGDKATIDMIR